LLDLGFYIISSLTLRFEMEDTKNLNLVPRTSSARKLTYSSEDIKREDTG
jgi:hypothetical protein